MYWFFFSYRPEDLQLVADVSAAVRQREAGGRRGHNARDASKRRARRDVQRSRAPLEAPRPAAAIGEEIKSLSCTVERSTRVFSITS